MADTAKPPPAGEIIEIMRDIEGIFTPTVDQDDQASMTAVHDMQTQTAELCERQQQGIKHIIRGKVAISYLCQD
jgi:hypothetical protein